MDIKSKLEELFGIDLRSLALFRICLGLIILVDLFLRSINIKAFYTDAGPAPREIAMHFNNKWHLSLHYFSGKIELQILLFFIAAIFAIFLILGYKTKVTTIVSWILLISVHNRNLLTYDIGDYILRLLLFWSMFLPLGAHCSIDSALNFSNTKIPKRILSFGTSSLLLQVVFIFIFPALLKLKDNDWQNGTALYYVLHLIPYVTLLGKELLKIPMEYLKLLTHIVVKIEMYAPFLLFFPVFNGLIRSLSVVILFFMLTGFGLSLGIPMVTTITSIGLIPFIPSWFWDNLGKFDFKFKLLPDLGERLNSWNKNLFPYKPINYCLSKAGNICALLLIIYLFFYNLGSINDKYKIPSKLTWIADVLRIDQRWGMFIPTTNGWQSYWFVFPARLSDGSEVDLFTNGGKVSYETPELSSATYKNTYWKRYILNVAGDPLYKSVLPYYSLYLCNEWNSKHGDTKKLEEFDFYVLMHKAPLDKREIKQKKILYWNYSCIEKCPDNLTDTFNDINNLEEKYRNETHVVLEKYSRKGAVCFYQSKLPSSEMYYEKYLELYKKLGGKDSEILPVLNILYSVYQFQNKSDKTEEISNRIKNVGSR